MRDELMNHFFSSPELYFFSSWELVLFLCIFSFLLSFYFIIIKKINTSRPTSCFIVIVNIIIKQPIRLQQGWIRKIKLTMDGFLPL